MEINLVAPINLSSYGYTSLMLLQELQRAGHDVNLSIISQMQVENQEQQQHVMRAVQQAQQFSYDAPCVRLWHQHDMTYFMGRGPHIGFPIFELRQLTEVELYNLDYCDRLFVPSEWAKQVVEEHLPHKQVDVVPLGVDRSIFFPAPSKTEAEAANDGRFSFINIGKLEHRKGHDMLPRAFAAAFPADRDVELVLGVSNPFIPPERLRQYQQEAMQITGGRVRFLPRLPTMMDVAAALRELQQQGGCCGVYPSRAEGWNLPLLESMSMGMPVIATDYSAHTQFCTEENAHLIEINEFETAHDPPFFRGQGEWAKLGEDQFEQLVNHMRKVRQNDSRNEAGERTANEFTWKNSALAMAKLLQ